MDPTAEIRWFFTGPPPRQVVEWFDDRGIEPSERTDLYLRLVETDALGVKLRDSGTHLEFKMREQDLGDRVLQGDVVGRVERWQKWSLAASGDQGLGHLVGLSADLWVEVRKLRRLARFPGCFVELTDLRVADQEWSTIGFEAYGPEGDLLTALTGATDEFLRHLDLRPDLRTALSCGYPGWLRTLDIG